MNRQGISDRPKFFVESFTERNGAALRFNQRKIAVIRAHARHHPAQE